MLRDAAIELSDEVIRHAERHGFVPSEDFAGWVLSGDGSRREALFHLLDRYTVTFSVEVIKNSDHSMWRAEITGADYSVENRRDPEADYLDDLEELLVEAKRLVG
jgi:hypothetical protein